MKIYSQPFVDSRSWHVMINCRKCSSPIKCQTKMIFRVNMGLCHSYFVSCPECSTDCGMSALPYWVQTYIDANYASR